MLIVFTHAENLLDFLIPSLNKFLIISDDGLGLSFLPPHASVINFPILLSLFLLFIPRK